MKKYSLNMLVILMSNYIGKYKKNLSLKGVSKVNRAINETKRSLSYKLLENPSCKSVVLSGVDCNLCILSGKDSYTKKIHSLPYETFRIGEVVEWENSYGDKSKWLIVETDHNSDITTVGVMRRCNYVLSWKSEGGNEISKDCVILSDVSYSSGIEEKAHMSTGSSRLTLYVPCDNDTKRIKRGMKFVIDNTDEEPMYYEVVNSNRVSDVYDGYGVLKYTLSEYARLPSSNTNNDANEYIIGQNSEGVWL